MTTVDERCGTPAGYQAHRKRKEPACDACRRANAEYTAAVRASNPGLYAQNVANNSARSRAMTRLARLHPDEFKALYREELRKSLGVAS